MKNSVQVFAPATVANVACGFDIFGFALQNPGDIVTLRTTQTPTITISKITGDNGKLSLDPNKNTVSVGIIKMLEKLKNKQGFDIELQKNMPLGSGLGSSAASAAAGIYAANHLLGSPFEARDLIPFAMEAERVACGSAHADNVAPSLLGGFVLVRSYSPLDVVQIPFKKNLFCTILHPNMEIKTEMARQVLKQDVPLKDVITQTGNAAGLITGLMQGDYALIGRSLVDVIAEPARAKLIPGFSQIKQAAMESGALGCSISGSGPSIFALSTSLQEAEKTGNAMQIACAKCKMESTLYISEMNMTGPVIVSKS